MHQQQQMHRQQHSHGGGGAASGVDGGAHVCGSAAAGLRRAQRAQATGPRVQATWGGGGGSGGSGGSGGALNGGGSGGALARRRPATARAGYRGGGGSGGGGGGGGYRGGPPATHRAPPLPGQHELAPAWSRDDREQQRRAPHSRPASAVAGGRRGVSGGGSRSASPSSPTLLVEDELRALDDVLSGYDSEGRPRPAAAAAAAAVAAAASPGAMARQGGADADGIAGLMPPLGAPPSPTSPDSQRMMQIYGVYGREQTSVHATAAAHHHGSGYGGPSLSRPSSSKGGRPRPNAPPVDLKPRGLYLRGNVYVDERGALGGHGNAHAASAPGVRGGPRPRPATAPGSRRVAPVAGFQGYAHNPNTVDRVLETALRLARQYGSVPPPVEPEQDAPATMAGGGVAVA